MKDLTVIIPILKLEDKEQKALFESAVKSAEGAENIIVVGSKEALDSVKRGAHVTLLENTTDDFSYAAQVNFAVDKVTTKYFSVLEFDDTFTSIWYKNVEDFISSDVDNTFAILPLTEVFDTKLNTIIGYANEAYWASSFSDEIGVLDLASLTEYLNFNVSGAIFLTDEFKALGGLKASMKLVNWYEFLLRALYNQKRMYVIPKVGYIHKVGRDGSVTEEYAKTMSEKEAEWWIELAKKEYYFKQDRKKKYEE
jgi:hypothetical protein